MKKLYSLLAIHAFCFSFAQNDNLVQNPSFENGNLLPWLNGMSENYSLPELIQNSEQSSSGEYYVKYNPKKTTGFYQKIPTIPGQSYILSFWYKSGSYTTHARLWSNFSNAHGRTKNYVTNVFNDPLRNFNEWLPYSSDWTLHVVEFTTPEQYPIFQLGLRAYLGGEIYFDDFTVEEKRFIIMLDVDDLKFRTKDLVKSTTVTDIIEFKNPIKNLEIFGTNGQRFQKKAVESLERLNIHNLPNGVYILRGEVNGEIVTQKIIKK